MQTPSSVTAGNNLLAALPQRDRRLDRVYFPTSGFISLVMTVDERSGLGVGLIGSEGMCGASLTLGVNIARLQAVVQRAGSAVSLDARSFASACASSRSLARMMGRYTVFQLGSRAQLAACTHFRANCSGAISSATAVATSRC